MRLNRIDFLCTVAIGLVLICHFKVQGLGYQIGWIGRRFVFRTEWLSGPTTLFVNIKRPLRLTEKYFDPAGL